MRGRSRKREHLLLNLWACFLLPGYTLLFAGGAWLNTNFSVRAAAGAGAYRGFLVWGALAGGYFLVLLTRMSAALRPGWPRRSAGLLLSAAAVELGLGLPLPYLPERCPRLAQLHTLLLFSACAGLMGAMLILLLALEREDSRYGPLVRVWWAVTAGCAGLFALSGIISTALEVFLTLSAAQLVRVMWLYREH